MKKANNILIVALFILPFITSAQVFDGFSSGHSNLGFKKGDFSYVTFGTDVGIMKYLSVGASMDYAFATPIKLDKPLFFEIRADIHGSTIVDMGMSDVLIGYNNDFDGTQGVHGIYQYYLSDFFGFYGRTTYNFKVNDQQFFNDISDAQKFRFELGIIFRTFGGWSGSSW